MATITVRAIDTTTGEPQNGNGQNNFISDLDAVTQIIATRLKLYEGEWFLNLADGLPLFQSILGAPGGARNIQVIANFISARILGTPFVTSISAIEVSYQNRRLLYKATVNTEFGTVTVQNAPGTGAVVTSSSNNIF